MEAFKDMGIKKMGHRQAIVNATEAVHAPPPGTWTHHTLIPPVCLKLPRSGGQARVGSGNGRHGA